MKVVVVWTSTCGQRLSNRPGLCVARLQVAQVSPSMKIQNLFTSVGEASPPQRRSQDSKVGRLERVEVPNTVEVDASHQSLSSVRKMVVAVVLLFPQIPNRMR